MIRVSLIIPTYNRLDSLKMVLQGLEAQTFPTADFEVIVVSDGSQDGTDAYLKVIQTPLILRPIFQRNGGASAARNAGVKAAEGDILLFLDDDVLPDKNLVAQHYCAQSEAGVSRVEIGPLLTPPGYKMLPWVAYEQVQLEKQYQDMQAGKYLATARQFYTGNASLKRAFFNQCGGFDLGFRRAEDVEFAYRMDQLGAEFVFNPEAKGFHYARRSFESWLQTPYAYGTNDVVFTHEKGVTWLLPTVVREYSSRHWAIRWLVERLLDRKNTQKIVITLVKGLGSAIYRWVPRFSRYAFSIIFNLRYYQGMADQLGGKSKLLKLIDAVRSSGF